MNYYNLAKLEAWERSVITHSDHRCVFISHKKEDEDAANAIGNYLTNVAGINIYLDTQDCVLREAVSTENDQKIVDSIQNGLTSSSHLLCLISDNTKLSWWVPYEIGFADKQGIDIAALKLNNVDDIPSYLKTKRALYTSDDFLRYIGSLGQYGSLFSEATYTHLSTLDNEILTRYID